MTEDDVRPRRLYRNLKTKNVYKVTGFSVHTETGEIMILYRQLEAPASIMLWARPLDLFLKKFEPASSVR